MGAPILGRLSDRIGRRPVFNLGQARRDGRLDLLGQIEVVTGQVGEEGVDEMQPAEVFELRHFFGFPRLLISSMNSDTSRNSL